MIEAEKLRRLHGLVEQKLGEINRVKLWAEEQLQKADQGRALLDVKYKRAVEDLQLEARREIKEVEDYEQQVHDRSETAFAEEPVLLALKADLEKLL